MLNFFDDRDTSKSPARDLANTVKRNTEIVNKSSIEIRKVFFTVGYKFDLNKFVRVSSSMFSMLIIDNIKKRDHYDEEDLDAFIEEIDEEYLLQVNPDASFNAKVSDRDALKREAAEWAAEMYFEEQPTRKQSNLFYERAEKFVDYIEDHDVKNFD